MKLALLRYLGANAAVCGDGLKGGGVICVFPAAASEGGTKVTLVCAARWYYYVDAATTELSNIEIMPRLPRD